MHSSSQKCQSDQQRLEVLMCLSLTCSCFLFPLYLFVYLNVHTFCAKHCCSIFLILKVWLAIVSLEKWHSLLWAPKEGIKLRKCNFL